MKKLLALGVLSVLVACEAQPIYAPMGAQISVNPESITAYSGALIQIDAVVFDSETGDPYNNVIIEFSTGISSVFPAEALGGSDNQPDGETGANDVGWCNADALSEAELEACLESYFIQLTEIDASIAPNYARLVTDSSGKARIYLLAFCFDSVDETPYCYLPIDEDGEAVKLQDTLYVSIGVDAFAIPISSPTI